MRKAVLIFLVLCTIFVVYGKTDEDMRLLEESITKDYDQDGKYSAYEKALRRAQESIYVALPEKRLLVYNAGKNQNWRSGTIYWCRSENEEK